MRMRLTPESLGRCEAEVEDSGAYPLDLPALDLTSPPDDSLPVFPRSLLRCLLGVGAEIEWRVNQRLGKRSPKRHRRKGTPSRLAKGWNPATKVNDS